MRKATAVLLIGALIGTGACIETGAPARVEAPETPEEGEVPLELAGPGGAALLVPVVINGEGPFQFVLDTGATLTCVEQELAERLDLPRETGAVGLGAGVGAAGQIELVRVDSLRVGEARAEALTACVLDLEHTRAIGVEIDGLLGLNVLREFLVTLDFSRNVLRLEEP